MNKNKHFEEQSYFYYLSPRSLEILHELEKQREQDGSEYPIHPIRTLEAFFNELDQDGHDEQVKTTQS